MTHDLVLLAVGVLFGVLAGAPAFVLLLGQGASDELPAWQAQRQQRLRKVAAEVWPAPTPDDAPLPAAAAQTPTKSRWELLELDPRRRALPALPPIRRRWRW